MTLPTFSGLRERAKRKDELRWDMWRILAGGHLVAVTIAVIDSPVYLVVWLCTVPLVWLIHTR